MRGRARLAALLEMYDTALAELVSWNDPAVTDLAVRLGVWRMAAELELQAVDAREHAVAA